MTHNNYRYRRGSADAIGGPVFIAILVFIAIGIIAFLMFVLPFYGVWSSRMKGQGLLAEAESSRMIAVTEAKAKMEAASMLADAEIERAKGVAEANKIIGDSLRDNEAYLRWLWIEGLRTEGQQIIYVPTEAGLPILEAGRR